MVNILLIVAGCLCLFGCLFKRNRVITIFFIGLLIILFGWNFDNADMGIYQARYINYQIFSSATEPVYTFFLSICHTIGLDFRGYMITLALLFVSTISFVILKTAINPNIVFSMFTVFPLCFLITAQRFTFGLIFSTLALYFLLYKNNYILFNVLAIIGGLCHFSLLFLLIYQLANIRNHKFIVCFTGVLFTLFLIVNPYRIGLSLSNLIGKQIANKITFVSRAAMSDNLPIKLKFIFIVLFFFAVFFCMNYLMDKPANKNIIDTKITNLNILNLLLIPIILINNDFWRIQLVLYLFNYIFLSNNLMIYQYKSIGGFYKKNVYWTFLLITASVTFLYITIFMMDIQDTVFFPVFNSNLFF